MCVGCGGMLVDLRCGDYRQLELFSGAELLELGAVNPLLVVVLMTRAMLQEADNPAAVARHVEAPLAHLVRELDALEEVRGLVPTLAAAAAVAAAGEDLGAATLALLVDR